jgi:hypothetical protein
MEGQEYELGKRENVLLLEEFSISPYIIYESSFCLLQDLT